MEWHLAWTDVVALSVLALAAVAAYFIYCLRELADHEHARHYREPPS